MAWPHLRGATPACPPSCLLLPTQPPPALHTPCGAGLSDADWADVSAFYGTWASFSTVKDFAWADQYHTGQAPNRKVRAAGRGGAGRGGKGRAGRAGLHREPCALEAEATRNQPAAPC